MGKIKILLCSLLLCGCVHSNTPKVIQQTNYQEVKIPVVYKIDKPSRPEYNDNDTIVAYLLKVLEYTQQLEIYISTIDK